MRTSGVSVGWLAAWMTAAGIAACTVTVNDEDDDANGGESQTGGRSSAAGGSTAKGGAAAKGGTTTGGTENDAGADTGEGGTENDAGADTGEGGTENGDAGSGGSGDPSGDACGAAETTSNNTRETATAYELGTDYLGCLQDGDDIDFYEFTTPEMGDGGYVVVGVTDVGTTGDISMEGWAAADNTEFVSNYNASDGGSVHIYFNAEPGATFRVPVTKFSSADQTPYLFKATFYPVEDAHEPNDLRTAATAITVGTPVEAYMFAGYENGTGLQDADWYDWYSVPLEEGPVTVELSIVASDVDGQIVLYNPAGADVKSAYEAANGTIVTLTYTVPVAGTYALRVAPFSNPAVKGTQSTVPQYLTEPYTLTVTQ